MLKNGLVLEKILYFFPLPGGDQTQKWNFFNPSLRSRKHLNILGFVFFILMKQMLIWKTHPFTLVSLVFLVAGQVSEEREQKKRTKVADKMTR